MLTVHTKDEQETLVLGTKVGKSIFPSAIIALIGELGSGKTVLVRGIAKGMGITARVRSPSFVIVNQYPGQPPLYHFDLYRLDDPSQLDEIGYQEYFFTSPGVVVIEWADKAAPLLPPDYLEIRFEMKNMHKRKITLSPQGDKKYHRWLKNIKSEIKC